MNALFSISIFLISLYNLYWGLPVVTIFGVGLLCIYKLLLVERGVVKLNPALLYFSCLFLICVVGVFFGSDISIIRFFGYLSFFVLLVAMSSHTAGEDVARVLNFFFFIHLAFFYFQFLSYYIAGQYISILDVFGLESRNLGGSLILPWGAPVMRASGLFSEPGTYACFMAPMTALYAGYISKPYTKLVFFFALASLALSLSTFGLFFFAVISFFAISSILYRILLLVLGLAFSLPYLYWRFYIKAQHGMKTGLDFRYEYISAAFDNFRSVDGFLFGTGGLSVNNHEFVIQGADNDSGLIFYILYNFGGLSFILTLAFLGWAVINLNRFASLGLMILFISKVSFYAYIFPVYMYLLLYKKLGR